ncbi:MAG: hypothetical protein DHS20C01_26610 [marine bacterium B5-7]|nr:MAG: hypothetical protein DHS20C01_26610 [marine bacterium B5-7]
MLGIYSVLVIGLLVISSLSDRRTVVICVFNRIVGRMPANSNSLIVLVRALSLGIMIEK